MAVVVIGVVVAVMELKVMMVVWMKAALIIGCLRVFRSIKQQLVSRKPLLVMVVVVEVVEVVVVKDVLISNY